LLFEEAGAEERAGRDVGVYEEVNSRFAEVDEAKCQAEKNKENCFPNHWSGIEKYPLQKVL
jgi:hypothetical protein